MPSISSLLMRYGGKQPRWHSRRAWSHSGAGAGSKENIGGNTGTNTTATATATTEGAAQQSTSFGIPCSTCTRPWSGATNLVTCPRQSRGPCFRAWTWRMSYYSPDDCAQPDEWLRMDKEKKAGLTR